MITIDRISKSYGDKTIFEQLSCQFDNGKIYALVGVNGIGKTTFMSILTQGSYKDRGTVKIDNINNESFESKYHFFYIPDKKDMFLNLTGMEYLNFILKIYHKTHNHEKIMSLANKLKISNDLSNEIKHYSLGMKQKVYLIGALISEANNLILDEPFNGLDPEIAVIVKKLLTDYKKSNRLILYSIHNLDVVSNFCDNVILIDKKRQFYTMENTCDIKKLEEIFFDKCVVEYESDQ